MLEQLQEMYRRWWFRQNICWTVGSKAIGPFDFTPSPYCKHPCSNKLLRGVTCVLPHRSELCEMLLLSFMVWKNMLISLLMKIHYTHSEVMFWSWTGCWIHRYNIMAGGSWWSHGLPYCLQHTGWQVHYQELWIFGSYAMVCLSVVRRP